MNLLLHKRVDSVELIGVLWCDMRIGVCGMEYA